MPLPILLRKPTLERCVPAPRRRALGIRGEEGLMPFLAAAGLFALLIAVVGPVA